MCKGIYGHCTIYPCNISYHEDLPTGASVSIHTVPKNNQNLRIKTERWHGRSSCNGIQYVWFFYQICTFTFLYRMYISLVYKNQTITVASASTVTSSAFTRRFRLFCSGQSCSLVSDTVQKS